MEFVPGFGLLLQELAVTMTAPTFESFVTILTGWVFAPRRTVTRMILAYYYLAHEIAECQAGLRIMIHGGFSI